MRFLPLVLKNVFRKRTRSLLTAVSVLFPVLVICVLGTLLATLDSDPSGGRGMFRLVVRHKVSITNFFPEAHLTKVRELPGVKEVTPFNWFGGQYKDSSAFNVFSRFSVDPEVFLRVFDEATIVEGSAAEWQSDRAGLLVGKMLMKKYGWRLGQQVAMKGDIFPGDYTFTIRAVFTGQDESTVFFDRAYVEEKVPRFKGNLLMLWVKTESAADSERLTGQIDALFENSPSPTRTETEKAFQNSWIGLLGNVRLLLTSIVVIISGVIVLIAGNTMALSARERVTEIAVLRVLGFTKRRVLGLVLGESVLLALTGGLLGLGLFALVFPGMKQTLLYSPLAGFAAGMHLFPSVLAAAFTITVLVGVLAGLVPALRSSRRSIVDGLRSVA